MKRTTLFFCLLFLVFESRAQSVTASTGGEGSAGGVTISYTVGEAFVSTIKNDSSILTQGFHQPEFEVTAIHEAFLSGLIEVFPNPTTSILQVRLSEINAVNIQMSVIDRTGRSIAISRADDEIWQADLSGLPSGVYLLTVADTKTNQASTFKILKIN